MPSTLSRSYSVPVSFIQQQPARQPDASAVSLSHTQQQQVVLFPNFFCLTRNSMEHDLDVCVVCANLIEIIVKKP